MAVLQRHKSTIYGLVTDLETLQNNITAEYTRAVGVEGDITSLNTEAKTDLVSAINELYGQIGTSGSDLQDAIDAEAALRIAADETLQDNIDAEEAARILGDETLTNALADEVAARIADVDAEEARALLAEEGLSNAISALESSNAADISDLQAELDATQVGAGLSEDGSYIADSNSYYLGEASSLNDADLKLDIAIKAVDTAYKAADVTLTTNLNNEISRATAAESTLTNALAAEAATRAAADATETAARIAADAILSNAISTEASTRSTEDSAINLRIDNLESTIAVGSAIKGSFDTVAELDTLVESELEEGWMYGIRDTNDVYVYVSYVTGDFDYQPDGWTGGFIQFVNVADVTNAVANEASLRTAADLALQAELDATQLNAGLEINGTYAANTAAFYISDASSLKDADNMLDAALKVEEVARIADVRTLTNTLNTEISRATTAEETLTNALADETAARTAADSTLTTNLNNEISRATTAEEGLANAIAALESAVGEDLTIALANEESARILADEVLTNALADEVAARIADVDAEEARATLAEEVLTNALADEVARATLAEETNANAIAALDADTYSMDETDEAIRLGGAIFVTETVTVSGDTISLTHSPKNGIVFNFATVRHVDANFVSYDIPVVQVTDLNFTLSADVSGQFDGKSVIVQYAYVPEA